MAEGVRPLGSSLTLLGFVGERWEIRLASKLRDKYGAGCGWVAGRMRFSSAAFIRKLLSEN